MPTLRVLGAHRRDGATLLLTVAVGQVGTVAAAFRTQGTTVTPLVTVPLLLVCLMAVTAAVDRWLADDRAAIGLARMRGVSPATTLRVVAGPIVGCVVAAALVATVIGRQLGHGLTEAPARTSPWPWLVALALPVLGVVVVLVVGVRLLREPLHHQLDARSRPEPASVGRLAPLVVAGVATLAAAVQIVTSDGTGRAPVAAVAVGTLAVAVAGGACTVLVPAGRALSARAARSGSDGWLIAGHRLTHRADQVPGLQAVVAAFVVAGTAASAWQSASAWLDDQTHLDSIGPVTVTLRGDARTAVTVADRLDPDGRWLAGAATDTGTTTGDGRSLYVDARRWPRVLGATQSAQLAGLAPDLASGTAREPLPVVVAGAGHDRQTTNLDGRSVAVRVVGHADALPYVGTAGVLADLRSALARAQPSAVGVTPLVLARSDVPAALMRRLRDDPHVTAVHTVADVRDRWTGRSDTQGAAVLASVAVPALVLAVVTGVAAALAGMRRRRLDAAALRVVRLPGRDLARADLVESLVLGVVAGAATAAGTALGTLLLPSLALVPQSGPLPAFQASVAGWPMLLLAVASAATVTACSWCASRGATRRAVPGDLLGGDR